MSHFTALLAKDLIGYFVNHRTCFPHRFYFWSSLAAPVLAGGVHYLLLRWLMRLLWHGDPTTSVLISFLSILPSFPVFAWLHGFFGGWDTATLAELRGVAALSGFVRPLAWVFWASSALGARLSPLHNRFPITICSAALEEAATLTREKVLL